MQAAGQKSQPGQKQSGRRREAIARRLACAVDLGGLVQNNQDNQATRVNTAIRGPTPALRRDPGWVVYLVVVEDGGQ